MKINVFDLNNFDNLKNKNLVLEASAGTGKTYTITEMVSKLVKSGKDLKKMLIVTYTEKATGELKGRIRSRLIEENKGNKQILSDVDNINIYTIHSFCQNAINEFGLEANQPLNLDVIDEPTELQTFFDEYVRNDPFLSYISNNGINGDVLKNMFIETVLKYYLNSKNEVENSIVSIYRDKEMDEIYDSIGDEAFDVDHDFTFDYLYDTLDEFKEKIDFIKSHNEYEYKFLEEYIKLSNIKRISFDFSYGSKFEAFNDTEQEAYNFLNKMKNKVVKGDTFDEMLERLDTKYPGVLNSYNIISNSDDIRLVLLATFIKDSTLINGSKFSFSANYNIIDYIKPNSDEEREKLIDALDYILSLSRKIVSMVREKLNYVLYENIDDFYIKWQEEKARRKMQTFNDMLRTVRENILCGNPNFKKRLQEKYEIAIIDEFQDTNQIQFDVFKSIFMKDDKHRIIVVGDPKQSIYSFQGADLNVYMKAKEEIVNNGGEIFNLSTNYRSTEKMIDSCNRFFDNTNEYFTDIDFPYSSSPINNKRKVTYKGKDTKAFWIGECPIIEKKKKQDDSDENDKKEDLKIENIYARIVVNQIIDFCSKDKNGNTNLRITEKSGNERNISFSDFTVLARTRSEMEPIISELKKCGIPYIKYKDNGLFISNECYHWISILEAINTIDFTGRNRRFFKRALFTKFFDRSLEEINTDYYNHDDNKEMELILKWKELANNKKWEDLIESILDDSDILNRLNDLDKFQSLSLFKQIGDYCISYLYDNHNLDELIIDLKNATVGDSDDDDNNTVEISTDFDAVKIMTIHASKGLQFPIVISVAGFKGFNRNPKAFICHMENKNTGLMERKISTKFGHSEKDTLEEWERLTYVNYTRAEYLLLMPLYNKEKTRETYEGFLNIKTKKYMEKEENQDDFILLSYDNNEYKYYKLKQQVKDILGESVNNEEDRTKQLESIKSIIKKSPNLASYKHSYSELSHGAKEELELIDEDDRNLEGDKQEGLSKYDKLGIQINSMTSDISPIDIPLNFPKGSKIGEALHEIFELLDYTKRDNLDSIIGSCLSKQKIKLDEERFSYIKEMVSNVLDSNLIEIIGNKSTNNTFKLSSIPNKDKKCEIEFNYNKENEFFKNYFNGFIDLLFRRGDIYSILDWKSDSLNENDFINYNTNESLKKHTDNSYSIQRVLY